MVFRFVTIVALSFSFGILMSLPLSTTVFSLTWYILKEKTDFCMALINHWTDEGEQDYVKVIVKE